MLRFTDSWGYYATADLLSKWTSIIPGSSPQNATVGVYGVDGGTGLRLETTSNNSDAIQVVLPASGPTCIAGCYFKTSSLLIGVGTSEGSNASAIFAVRLSGASMVWFRLNADGTVSALRSTTVLGTSTFALSANTFYYLEFKVTVSNTVGVVQFRRDGILDATLNLSSIDTNNGGASDTWNAVKLGDVDNGGGAPAWDYSHLYVLDGSGSYNNDFKGVSRVDAHFVNGVGNSNMSTPSTGSDRSLTVDEALANGNTDYNTFAAVNDQDTYLMGAHPVPGATVHGVQLNAWVSRVDVGAATVQGVLRMGGTDYAHGTDAAPTQTTYTNARFIWDRSPVDGTTAFTTTDIDAIEAGLVKTM